MKTIQTLNSDDGLRSLEFQLTENGYYQFMEFKWVPYDSEMQGNLGRPGDWNISYQSGLYLQISECQNDAKAKFTWLEACKLT